MAAMGVDPSAVLRDFLRESGGCAIIDGGLATELEANGADLNDPLWSAKCLIASPELIRKAGKPNLVVTRFAFFCPSPVKEFLLSCEFLKIYFSGTKGLMLCCKDAS